MLDHKLTGVIAAWYDETGVMFMRGQMLLIVVLVMVVILTIALAIATRTITHVRISNDEENSERAFSAAEAGLEQALGRNQNVTGTLDNTSTYRTNILQLGGAEFLLNNKLAVLRDDAVDVWLSNYPNYNSTYTGNVTIYWGSPGGTCSTSQATNSMAALDIVVITGTRTNPVSTHYPVDPCAARAGSNRFEVIPSTPTTILGRTFAFRKSITVTSGLLARVVPLYAPTVVAVRGCNAAGTGCAQLPAQGTVIESVGTASDAQRKIVTVRSYPKLPAEIFPFVIFGPN